MSRNRDRTGYYAWRDARARDELADLLEDLGRIDPEGLRRLQERWKSDARSGANLHPRHMLRDVNAELTKHLGSGDAWEEMAWDDSDL